MCSGSLATAVVDVWGGGPAVAPTRSERPPPVPRGPARSTCMYDTVMTGLSAATTYYYQVGDKVRGGRHGGSCKRGQPELGGHRPRQPGLTIDAAAAIVTACVSRGRGGCVALSRGRGSRCPRVVSGAAAADADAAAACAQLRRPVCTVVVPSATADLTLPTSSGEAAPTITL